MNRKKCSAIVLAAGVGKRMQSDIPKQYMLLEGKPLLYYALKTFIRQIINSIIYFYGLLSRGTKNGIYQSNIQHFLG